MMDDARRIRWNEGTGKGISLSRRLDLMESNEGGTNEGDGGCCDKLAGEVELPI
ncbi:MAG TPA: hypothetical protein PKW33_12365 [Anaerolineaceae bacterium]|nr:hypothetical protein [Anaerolineaceae bacterium]HPN52376.1 hypothetical protein [Anaerolineaceae bacterium]